jgi:hypothetical protein
MQCPFQIGILRKKASSQQENYEWSKYVLH